MSMLRLLAPPYRHLSWVGDGAPPLGCIVVAEADSAEALAGGLKSLLRRGPWCVPCLITGVDTATPRVLVAIHELPGHPAFIPGPIGPGGVAAHVLAAVRARPLPGGARLADYVVRRTGRPDLRYELAGLLGVESDPPEVDLPDRTLRDRLRRFGKLGAHCWRAVGALCRVATPSDRGSIERLATSVGIGPRTLRGWVGRYLAMSMAEFRSRIGWEWVLEAALRVGGYVETPQWNAPFTLRPAPVPRAVPQPSLLVSHPRPLRRWSRSVVAEAIEIPAGEPEVEPSAPA